MHNSTQDICYYKFNTYPKPWQQHILQFFPSWTWPHIFIGMFPQNAYFLLFISLKSTCIFYFFCFSTLCFSSNFLLLFLSFFLCLLIPYDQVKQQSFPAFLSMRWRAIGNLAQLGGRNFFVPFLFPISWNSEVMEGTQAITLWPRDSLKIVAT